MMDNRFRQLQPQGKVRKTYNVSTKEVEKLYKSSELDWEKPRSIQCRLIFKLTLITAMRSLILEVVNYKAKVVRIGCPGVKSTVTSLERFGFRNGCRKD